MELLGIFDNLYILPEIMRHAGWSIVVGILIAAGLVALLLFLIRGFYPKKTFSPVSLITSGFLGILLCLQFIPMCASIALKWKIPHFEMWINETIIHPESYPIPKNISKEQSTEIVEMAVEQYPILGTLVGSGEFTGFNTSNIAHAMAEELNRFLNRIIIKLLLVAVIETAVCAFIIIKSMGKDMNRRIRDRASQRRPSHSNGRRVTRPGPSRYRR